MESQFQNTSEFNIDIRKTIKLLLVHWKLIVILMAIGGLLMGAYNLYAQKTRATSIIYVNQDKISGHLTSEKNKSIVAKKLGISANEMPEVQVQIDKTNPYLINLSSSSSKIQENINYINTWANVIVEETQKFQHSDSIGKIEDAKIAFENANENLLNFLIDQNLSFLSFSQLEELTGIDLLSSTNIHIDSKLDLPVLSEDVLKELINLCSIRSITNRTYSMLSSNTNILFYSLKEFDPYIVEQAKETSLDLKSLVTNAFLGAVAGFVMTVVSLLFADWWKQGSGQNIQNLKTEQKK